MCGYTDCSYMWLMIVYTTTRLLNSPVSIELERNVGLAGPLMVSLILLHLLIGMEL